MKTTDLQTPAPGSPMERAQEMVEVLRQGSDSFLTTKVDAVFNWARKYSMFLYPFVTACCGMEFMSVAGPRYDIDRFGAALPRFSPRQSDLLIVVGTITHRQAPILKRVYDQMAEPKWVMVPTTISWSAWRGEKRGSAQPKRSRS